MSKLEDLRTQMNKINEQMLTLFKERMELSKKIAEEKAAAGKAIYDAVREREVLDQITEQCDEEIDRFARRFFQQLFSLSKSYQTELLFKQTAFTNKIQQAIASAPPLLPQRGTAATAGIFGSNAQMACDKLLPLGKIHYVNSFRAVFEAVEQGLCEFGVLPIENSSNGSVKEVYDLLEEKKCYIVRATKQWICHDLLANKGTKLEDIKVVYSHPQALGQCSHFLSTLPNVEIREYSNTAKAAEFVAQSKDNSIAAIAAPECAALFDLTVLGKNIQNNDNNYTRFICITKDLTIYPGANKISIVTSASHTPGGLGSLLGKFADLGINLTKLESRPIPGHNFEFLFYLDLEATLLDPKVCALFAELETSQEQFRLLGNYLES